MGSAVKDQFQCCRKMSGLQLDPAVLDDCPLHHIKKIYRSRGMFWLKSLSLLGVQLKFY